MMEVCGSLREAVKHEHSGSNLKAWGSYGKGNGRANSHPMETGGPLVQVANSQSDGNNSRMADKKVEIAFDTKADTTGAKQAESAIDDVSSSSSSLMRDALKSKESVEELAEAIEREAEAQKRLSKAQEGVSKELKESTQNTERAADAVRELADAEEDRERRLEQYDARKRAESDAGGDGTLRQWDQATLDKLEQTIDRTKEATEAVEDFHDTDAQGAREAAEAELEAQRQRDVIEAKRRRDEREAAEARELEQAQLNEITQATRAMVALQAAEFLRGMVNELQNATKAGGAFHDELGGLTGALEQTDNALGVMTAGLGAFVATGNPVIGTLAGIAGGASGVASAFADMKKAQKDLAVKLRELEEQPKRLLEAQQQLRREIGNDFLLETYSRETKELEKQEQTILRINALRGAKRSAEQTKADADITIARNTGGDVQAAEARALQVRIQNQLAELDESLGTIQRKADAAQEQADQALGKLRSAGDLYRDANHPEYKKLSGEADDAADEAESAKRDLAAARETYVATKEAIIAQGEASLSTLEADTNQAISEEAQKLRDSIYNGLKDSYASIQTDQQSIATQAAEASTSARTEIENRIQADASGVSEVIETKRRQIESEMQKLAQQVQGVTVSSEMTSSVTRAIQDLARSQDDFGKTIVASLRQVISLINEQAQAVENLQSELRQTRATW
ncbi:hypothetical protein JIN85_18380 [Luteolibacter pohnpeiensis]|uniref:Uncharacterized protein n=1 Tax=Luteolibacter pohnpeiensis TaxID=454153 RepID=A0A934VSK2_9BACT|nr:hypothetical protein [Luteolibacter pohnpeiensis]MBK1884391.1 hypothetical protein [Luteolibacter pohnpeiensis]